MMKRLLLFVILTFSLISSIFCLSPFFEVVTHQPLTPFYFLKISLENVPEDVHFIKVFITISNDTGEIEHSSHYPILKTITGESYSLVHFIWLAEPKLQEMQSDDFFQKPVKITCSCQYGPAFEPDFSLLQIQKDPKTNTRIPIHTIQLNCQEEEEVSFTQHHQKAVIFIHGNLEDSYETILDYYSAASSKGWKNEALKQYWQRHYQYDDVDYFEYQYDTLFQSAKFYGEKLSQILEHSGILNAYEEIFLVSYSIGPIVARYAMNTKLDKSEKYLGDHIDNAFLIAGPLEGSFFSNLTDYLSTQVPLAEDVELISFFENEPIPEYINPMLDFIFHIEEAVFDPNQIVVFFDSLLELYRTYPLLANVIFISLDDISAIGRQIIPFEGLNSMRYTSAAFLSELEGKMLFPEGTYLPNKELLELNERERFYDKMVLITSYIEDAQETLEKAIRLTKLFNPKVLFSNMANQSVAFRSELMSIPFVQFYGQRAFSLLMQKIGEGSADPLHCINDGFIPLWSEQLIDRRQELNEENLFQIKNTDHLQIRDHPQVLEILKDII